MEASSITTDLEACSASTIALSGSVKGDWEFASDSSLELQQRNNIAHIAVYKIFSIILFSFKSIKSALYNYFFSIINILLVTLRGTRSSAGVFKIGKVGFPPSFTFRIISVVDPPPSRLIAL